MLKLPSLWLTRWQTGDPFWHAFHLSGKIFREQPGRKTLRFIENDEAYFIKLHYGVGWKEIFKNLLQFRLPVLGAQNEYLALKKLAHYDFTPKLIGYGMRGKNPARQKSFVITRELACTVSLEDYCRYWKTQPPDLKLKRALIRKMAEIARLVHQEGVNHRDFYLCHFLLDITGGEKILNPKEITLYVIDWHRAQIRRHVPRRWRIKDLAGLYFSAMDAGITRKDLQQFVKIYDPEKKYSDAFWQAVKKRAAKLYQRLKKEH